MKFNPNKTSLSRFFRKTRENQVYNAINQLTNKKSCDHSGISNYFFQKVLICSCTILGKVPQESILGPLLFLTYRNDISDLLLSIQTMNFADDTALICDPKQSATNRYENIRGLAEKNELSLNIENTTSICFPKKTNHA